MTLLARWSGMQMAILFALGCHGKRHDFAPLTEENTNVLPVGIGGTDAMSQATPEPCACDGGCNCDPNVEACSSPHVCDSAKAECVGSCSPPVVEQIAPDAVDADSITDSECNNNSDVTSDSNHCGRCNHSCLGGACISGMCSPIVLATGQGAPTAIAVGAADVYWVNQTQPSSGGGVFRAPKNGEGSPTQVDATNSALAVAVDDSDVFWASSDENEIRVAALRGAGRTPLAVRAGAIGDLALAGSFVYWPERFLEGAAFFRVAKTGGEIETLGTSTATASLVVAQGECGYFAGGGNAGSHITRSCAGAGQIVFRAASAVEAVAGDDRAIYFVESGVKRLPLDLSGSPVTLAATAQRGIAIDNEFVFFIDGAPGQGPSCSTNWSINRVRKTGVEPSSPVILPPQACPVRIAVDDDAIYWTNRDSGQIMKVAK